MPRTKFSRVPRTGARQLSGRLPAPPRPGRAWDDSMPPAELPPEGQHLPFLELSVFSLHATALDDVYDVEVEVTNHGNAAAFQPVVELFEQWVPKREGGPSPTALERYGFAAIGRLEPHQTCVTRVRWGTVEKLLERVNLPIASAPLRPAEQMMERYLVATVFDPLLDLRPLLNVGEDGHFYTKVIRKPFASLTTIPAIVGVPQHY